MKQIQISEFGTPEVLNCLETDSPVPQPHQVIVRVSYAGLNPIDFKTRKGLGFVAEKVRNKLPWTPGYDISGKIISAGQQVSGWDIGQRVCGLVNFPLPAGGYSQEVAVTPEFLAPVPDNIPDDIAASVPLAGLTAWQGLFETGNLCSGQNVLVLAAAGGVGHLAIQLARHSGAHVWGTASENNHSFITRLGAQPIDYNDETALKQLPDMDFVFDGVGGETGINALLHLREGGTLVTLPTITAEQIASAAREQGKTALGYTVHPDAKKLQSLLQYIQDGQLRPEISGRFSLDEVAEAHRLLELGHVRGKLLLKLTD